MLHRHGVYLYYKRMCGVCVIFFLQVQVQGIFVLGMHGHKFGCNIYVCVVQVGNGHSRSETSARWGVAAT